MVTLRLFPKLDKPIYYFLKGVPGFAGPGLDGPVPGLDVGLPGFLGGVVLPHPMVLTSFFSLWFSIQISPLSSKGASLDRVST
jgi:hypothetical protein